MEKEVTSHSYLGIVLIALASLIGLGLGVLSIVNGAVGGEYISSDSVESVKLFSIPLVSKLSFIFSICCFGEFIFLMYQNYKLRIWDNTLSSHRSIISDCDLDLYEDSAQVRVPNKISLFQAIRCKLSDVSDLHTIGFKNVKTVNIVGKVEIQGNFYIIGNSKLARGLVLLSEGSEVNLTIKTKVNAETALGIYRIYDVI